MKELMLPAFLMLFLFSCGEEIGGGNINCEQTGPPVFNSAPSVIKGATSVDIVFEINQTAEIYIVIYTADQGALTPEQVKTEAQNTATLSNVKYRGVISLNCSNISSGETVITADGLPHGVSLFVYIVAESNSLDMLLQSEPTRIQVDMLELQPVETFPSAAESRDVLFLVYSPEAFLKNPDDTEYPAIIFLGGNGEIATQGTINLIRNNSLPFFLDKGGSIPFFVFSPQHIQSNWNQDMVNEMVEYAKSNYPIDPDRIHMTGISGGGIGTWKYAVNYPEQLASIIPISGSGNTGQACQLINIATWAFHNDPDGIVGTNGSINMVNAINNCNPAPSIPAELTLFEDGGHNAWRRVYDINHPDWSKTTVAPVDIYSWFLDQSK
jgi:predicted peptidase